MLRGLAKLTWLEIKIFVREPLGVVGTILVPVALVVGLGQFVGRSPTMRTTDVNRFVAADVPVFASILVLFSAVLSLVTIVAIYREGGILKRLRATPLRPHTILGAQVIVKLLFTALTLALMAFAGRRVYGSFLDARVVPFAIALLISGSSIVALGFVIASVVPTARFAQPAGAMALYPMLAVSGLFVPVAVLPPALQVVAQCVPLTYAVSLLRGIWLGDSWLMHAGDVTVLLAATVALGALSTRVFRWE
jgi:ABC-2 type transport system permease protein